jgi:hypothetical protein
LTQHPSPGQLSAYAPRVICFHEDEIVENEGTRLTTLYGKLIEQDNRYQKAVVNSGQIVLLSIEHDRALWDAAMGDLAYFEGQQFDLFPHSGDAVKKFPEDKAYYIPEFVADYLHEG